MRQIMRDGDAVRMVDGHGPVPGTVASLAHVKLESGNANTFDGMIAESNRALALVPFAEAAKAAIDADRNTTGVWYGNRFRLRRALADALALHPANQTASEPEPEPLTTAMLDEVQRDIHAVTKKLHDLRMRHEGHIPKGGE